MIYTYLKQHNSYPDNLAFGTRLGSLVNSKPVIGFVTFNMTFGNKEITAVNGIELSRYSDYWISVIGFENKNNRRFERGTSINKKQVEQLIKFLQDQYSAMQDTAEYPVQGEALKNFL